MNLHTTDTHPPLSVFNTIAHAIHVRSMRDAAWIASLRTSNPPPCSGGELARQPSNGEPRERVPER